MTKEDKELLLKDLCARLPYGVIIKISVDPNEITDLFKKIDNKDCSDWMFTDNTDWIRLNKDATQEIPVSYVKPYLRPMSSMTEVERNEYNSVLERAIMSEDISTSYMSVDWLNAHHFDYRGLIENGLALEAPEGMYKKD